MSGRRSALRLLRQGDRIYLLATLGVVALLGVMAIGPVKSYIAAADRVDQLYRSRAELQSQVDRLEQRRLELANPEEIELLAREQLGLVRPGEIPYVIVAPSPDLHRMGPTAPEAVHQPWYRRLGQALRGLHS